MIDRRFPDDPRGPDAFKYALELYLRAIPNLDAPVDGWTFLRVVSETPTKMHTVGISYVLPSSRRPIEAEFHLVGNSIEYRILVGIDDDQWRSLSESKRWKAVYAYAVDGADAQWGWDRPVTGTLQD